MGRIKIETPDEARLAALGVKKWSPWGCDASTFDWQYDAEEVCYILEGRARIKGPTEEVEIKKGDLVTFPKDLKCVWKVIEKISKVYTFR